jgi:hypothetical protein
MRRLANRFEEIARGMIFGIADDGDLDAEAMSGGPFGNCFRRVVGSFGVNVGMEIFEEGFDARFAEEHDVVDAAECGDQFRAGVFVKDGTTGPFEVADACVRINADHEDVALAASSFEIADVAYVERIKTAVSENDALSVFFVLR